MQPPWVPSCIHDCAPITSSGESDAPHDSSPCSRHSARADGCSGPDRLSDNHFDGGTGSAPSSGGGGSSTTSLTALVLLAGTLNPAFNTGTTSYTTMAVNTSSLTPGSNTITVVLTDGSSPQTYTITVNYLAQEAYIKASNPNPADGFYAVALSGDTLAVRAGGEDSNTTGVGGNQADNSASDAGAVYVLTY